MTALRKILQIPFCRPYKNAAIVGEHMRWNIMARFLHDIPLNSLQKSSKHFSVCRTQDHHWRQSQDNFKNQRLRFVTASAGAFFLLGNKQLICEEDCEEQEVIEVENR